ncbi:sigma-70 family RNA polymerase sigma factor [Amycolatopsis sp. OK19-0408]|uniref:Sigma-70 family RNA polymerase sigma factor n=1 Tax=Amycolatopsis iheyensis TaxID=2945988 RepID=A0A9X2SRK8_9PSEU|nr:sigma-70 family RNA polymerase sigma factor [Amycolatopsis iheyensis]MCR6490676.1 sigma-70 family RNA polymerase sigma factor [Amycolatopsis iheyensis]
MEELLERVAGGDRSAFDRLYREFFGLVFHTVFKVVQDHAQSEEVTQETFLELWSTAARFDGAQGTGARWVTMIARRRAVDRVRSAQAARQRDTLIATQAQISTEPDPSEHVLDGVQVHQIRAALAKLSPEQRTLLTQAYIDGLTYRDIAAAQGVSVNTVKSRVRLAAAKLRGLITR